MKKIILGALVALLPLTSIADTVFGFKVGAGTWNHDPSGSMTVSSSGVGTTADLKNDLGLADDDEGYAYFSLEHPVPLLPNIKIMKTGLTTSGSGTISTTFQFNGITYDSTNSVTSNIQLDQTDYILYWEVLDNVVSLDIGLNAKYVDGKATATDVTDSQTSTTTFDGFVPMLYAAVELALPADLTIGVEASMLEVDDSEISDITAKITYTTDFMLGVEAGIRSQTIKLSGFDGINSNIEFDGVFAGLFFKF